MVCDEVQQLFVRQAPLNFRGLLDGIGIDALLDTRLPSGGIIRDLVRHVRVFVRYDVPAANATGAPVTATNTTPIRPPTTCRRVRQTWIPTNAEQTKSHTSSLTPRSTACAAWLTQVARSGSICASWVRAQQLRRAHWIARRTESVTETKVGYRRYRLRGKVGRAIFHSMCRQLFYDRIAGGPFSLK
jgi:hypothetical protein